MKKWNQQYHDKLKKHSMINQVCDEKNLEKACTHVKANKGSAGIDRVSIDEFEQNRSFGRDTETAQTEPLCTQPGKKSSYTKGQW